MLLLWFRMMSLVWPNLILSGSSCWAACSRKVGMAWLMTSQNNPLCALQICLIDCQSATPVFPSIISPLFFYLQKILWTSDSLQQPCMDMWAHREIWPHLPRGSRLRAGSQEAAVFLSQLSSKTHPPPCIQDPPKSTHWCQWWYIWFRKRTVLCGWSSRSISQIWKVSF